MRNMYELWMDQSREFFTTADEYLKNMFSKNMSVDPEENIERIQSWLKVMKQNWNTTQSEKDQKDYWQAMTKICNEAADLMLQEWIRLGRDNKPVNSIQDLYQLWMRCCSDVYQRSLLTKNFQDAYGDFMNTAFNFWNNAVPKN